MSTEAQLLAENTQAVLDEFRAAEALLEGHFKLSSGKHSAVYLQCARVMMDPARGARLCAALAHKVRQSGIAFDLCVSPAMGAVIVGYETARQLGVSSIFMERPEGIFILRRGFEIAPGARCLMIEDVVTTGKSSRECIAAIEKAGGQTVAAACLIDRSGGEADLGVPLTALATLTAPIHEPDALPPELAAIPAVKPGSRAIKV
ncbi:MAG: orotate phosphoribosyltransferase [Neomegalonema sp.]|nr:orotate phosphoribosyltransferase [Neomegalonema sp.]